MIARSTLTADIDATSRERSTPDSGRRSRRKGYLLVPAFAVIALFAAACNSSSSSGSSSADGLIAQGLSAESHSDSQQALNDFKAAVKADPTNAIAYYDLGVVYQEYLSNPDQAAAEYNKALLANPNYKAAMYNLATVETTTNPQGAITLYTQLLKLDPSQTNALFNLGLLQVAQSDPTTQLAGHANLKKAIAADPSLAKRVPQGITP